MGICYSDMKCLVDKLDAILRNQEITIKEKDAIIMGLREDLQQNMQDLRDLAQQYLDLIIAKDAAAAALAAENLRLVDALSLSDAEKNQLKADMQDAITSSQATEDVMRAGLPGVPPVGGTPLNPSYTDRAAFDAAVAAYTGPEAVTIDGTEVKAGTAPSLDYFTHSDAGGVVDTSGPTS